MSIRTSPPNTLQSITQSELKNALCAKNYEVGSVYSESYSNLVDLIKDTSVSQTDQNSVYSIHSEVEGTAKSWSTGTEELKRCTHLRHERHLHGIYEYEDDTGEGQCIHLDAALPVRSVQ